MPQKREQKLARCSSAKGIKTGLESPLKRARTGRGYAGRGRCPVWTASIFRTQTALLYGRSRGAAVALVTRIRNEKRPTG